MPYFKHTSTYEVVFRRFEYNAEVLNGEIQLIGDDHPCVILGHAPNKKLGYTASIIEKIKPVEGLQKIEELGREDEAKKGQPFYTLVTQEDVHSYISLHDHEFETKQKKEVKEVAKRSVKEKPPSKEIKKNSKKYSPKLYRSVNNEKPIKILI